MNRIHLDSTASTNSELAIQCSAHPLPHGTVLTAYSQTAGRGQRGNTWESEPGKNLTMSVLLKPRHIRPDRQFVISEIVALAVADTVNDFLKESASHHEVCVKWANDIYVGDNKICGILIEHAIVGNSISHTIAGIGLNVNQTSFHSDAPNPISLVTLTGKETDLDTLLDKLHNRILTYMSSYDSPDKFGELHTRYKSMLWRREGLHPYRRRSDGRVFNAKISEVAQSGLLSLTDTDGNTEQFEFKEVSAIINR